MVTATRNVVGEWATPTTLIRGGLWVESFELQTDDGEPASLEGVVVRVRIARVVGGEPFVEGRSDVGGSGVEILDQEVEETLGRVEFAIPLDTVPAGYCIGDIAFLGEDERPFAYVRGMLTIIEPIAGADE